MPFTTIVAPETLADGLGDPNWLVLDARFSLDDEAWGRRAHAEAHIPGALYADLATDLAGEIIPGKTGRRPLPEFQIWRKTLSRWGVTPNTQVVVYDSAGGMMAAARLWWMLRWAGHEAAAVLDGGLPGWLEEGRPVDKTVAARTPSSFEGSERDDLVADLAMVNKQRRNAAWAVFDSRSEEGFHGRGIYHDPVRGHIPGARLADRAATLGANGRFRSPEELRAHYQALLGGAPTEQVIFYCGSGVTAAQNLVGLAHSGLGDARHYIGSWSEWILDPERPVEL